MSGIIGVPHRLQTWPKMWQHLAMLKKPAGTRIVPVEGTAIAKQRNSIVDLLTQFDAEWVLFIDDDQVFAPDALERLLAWNVPMVGGLYLTRTPPYKSTAYRAVGGLDAHAFQPITATEIAQRTIVPVDSLGMGFTLIRRAVFEAVEQPWFRLGQLAPDECGEDVDFCLRARRAGVSIYCDTSLLIGHLTVLSVLPDPMNPSGVTFTMPEVAVNQANQVRPVPALQEV